MALFWILNPGNLNKYFLNLSREGNMQESSPTMWLFLQKHQVYSRVSMAGFSSTTLQYIEWPWVDSFVARDVARTNISMRSKSFILATLVPGLQLCNGLPFSFPFVFSYSSVLYLNPMLDATTSSTWSCWWNLFTWMFKSTKKNKVHVMSIQIVIWICLGCRVSLFMTWFLPFIVAVKTLNHELFSNNYKHTNHGHAPSSRNCLTLLTMMQIYYVSHTDAWWLPRIHTLIL